MVGWNNWGCCCGSSELSYLSGGCACYPLDTDGNPSREGPSLSAEENGPEYNSDCTKLGSGGASFKYGQGYLEGNHSCFSPRANPSGWAMSFWVKPISNIGVITCSTTVPPWKPGLITKGYWTVDSVSSYCAGETLGSATTHGEWFIVLERMTTSSPVEMVFYAVTANPTGSPGTSWSFRVVGAGKLDTRTSTFGAEFSEWNFVYWYARDNHTWLFIRGETESSWRQFHENLNTLGGWKNEDVPLRVGTMIEGSNEYRIGTNGGSYCVDNLMFNDSPITYGDPSLGGVQPEAPEEATALYNEGNGVACPGSK